MLIPVTNLYGVTGSCYWISETFFGRTGVGKGRGWILFNFGSDPIIIRVRDVRTDPAHGSPCCGLWHCRKYDEDDGLSRRHDGSLITGVFFCVCENSPILEPQVRLHTSHWTVEVDVLVWPVLYV